MHVIVSDWNLKWPHLDREFLNLVKEIFSFLKKPTASFQKSSEEKLFLVFFLQWYYSNGSMFFFQLCGKILSSAKVIGYCQSQKETRWQKSRGSSYSSSSFSSNQPLIPDTNLRLWSVLISFPMFRVCVCVYQCCQLLRAVCKSFLQVIPPSLRV